MAEEDTNNPAVNIEVNVHNNQTDEEGDDDSGVDSSGVKTTRTDTDISSDETVPQQDNETQENQTVIETDSTDKADKRGEEQLPEDTESGPDNQSETVRKTLTQCRMITAISSLSLCSGIFLIGITNSLSLTYWRDFGIFQELLFVSLIVVGLIGVLLGVSLESKELVHSDTASAVHS